MKNIVSIFMQDDNNLVAFLKSTKIIVFEQSDVWKEIKTIALPNKYSQNPLQLRKQISNIVNQLGECKIIAGKELIGIPYCVFDGNGFSIFSISQLNDKVLDGIINDIESANTEEYIKNEIIKNAKPVETNTPGVYYMDLIMLQTECPEISSKTALKDFLINTPFMELKLLCNHIPPWLENSEFDIISTKNADNNFLATITKKLCKEGF